MGRSVKGGAGKANKYEGWQGEGRRESIYAGGEGTVRCGRQMRVRGWMTEVAMGGASQVRLVGVRKGRDEGGL